MVVYVMECRACGEHCTCSTVTKFRIRANNSKSTQRSFCKGKKLPNEARSHPVSIYLLKVNNRNTRARCEISPKLTIKTPERC